MKNDQKEKIAEEDVMFFDIDPVLYGEQARVKPTPSSKWVWFNCFDFLYWLVDIGRLDYFDEDAAAYAASLSDVARDSLFRALEALLDPQTGDDPPDPRTVAEVEQPPTLTGRSLRLTQLASLDDLLEKIHVHS